MSNSINFSSLFSLSISKVQTLVSKIKYTVILFTLNYLILKRKQLCYMPDVLPSFSFWDGLEPVKKTGKFINVTFEKRESAFQFRLLWNKIREPLSFNYLCTSNLAFYLTRVTINNYCREQVLHKRFCFHKHVTYSVYPHMTVLLNLYHAIYY